MLKTMTVTKFNEISVWPVSEDKQSITIKIICLNVKDKPKVFWSYIKSKPKTRNKFCDLN